MDQKNNWFLKIKIEEYFLLFISLILFILFIKLGPSNFNFKGLFFIGSRAMVSAFSWVEGMVLFFFFYALLKLYIFLTKSCLKFIEERKIAGNYFRKIAAFEIKHLLTNIWFFLRPAIVVLIPSSFIILVLGEITQNLKQELVNIQLLKIDKFLTGVYPFIWFHTAGTIQKTVLDFFTPFIISSFLSLSIIIGVVAIIFYLDESKKLFSRYVIAFFTVVMFALPFWYFFPANSPNNAFLSELNTKISQPFLLAKINDYQPNEKVVSFENKLRNAQKETPPISTMPSMHIAWASIIVYYLFDWKKKTIIFSLPWFVFLFLGSVYLAQHYLIDGLISIPLALVSICLANLLVRLKGDYYQESVQERRFKEMVRQDWLWLFNVVKLFGNSLKIFKK